MVKIAGDKPFKIMVKGLHYLTHYNHQNTFKS